MCLFLGYILKMSHLAYHIDEYTAKISKTLTFLQNDVIIDERL